MTAALRADFVEALRRLAKVFDAYEAKTRTRPVLARGAAASIYTGGMITSGDFDVIAAAHEVFDAVMVDPGFRREDRAGPSLDRVADLVDRLLRRRAKCRASREIGHNCNVPFLLVAAEHLDQILHDPDPYFPIQASALTPRDGL